MLDAILTAAGLGFFAAIIPGPFTALVASTSLERGFKAGLRLALVPLCTDIPPMLATAFLLKRLNYDILTWVGIAGGIILAGLGARFFHRQKEGVEIPERPSRRHFWAVVSAGLLSPAPWIFWLVAASPLLLRAWNRSWVQGVVFASIFFALMTGTAAALAWMASHGNRRLNDTRRRQILRWVGVALVLAGGVLVWQSIEGNFQNMVRREEALRERIESSGMP